MICHNMCMYMHIYTDYYDDISRSLATGTWTCSGQGIRSTWHRPKPDEETPVPKSPAVWRKFSHRKHGCLYKGSLPKPVMLRSYREPTSSNAMMRSLLATIVSVPLLTMKTLNPTPLNPKPSTAWKPKRKGRESSGNSNAQTSDIHAAPKRYS